MRDLIRWIKKLTELEPRILLKVAQSIRFLRAVNEALAPVVGERNAAGIEVTAEKLLPPAVDVAGRLEAGFTEEEVLEVLKQAGFRSIIPAHIR